MLDAPPRLNDWHESSWSRLGGRDLPPPSLPPFKAETSLSPLTRPSKALPRRRFPREPPPATLSITVVAGGGGGLCWGRRGFRRGSGSIGAEDARRISEGGGGSAAPAGNARAVLESVDGARVACSWLSRPSRLSQAGRVGRTLWGRFGRCFDTGCPRPAPAPAASLPPLHEAVVRQVAVGFASFL